MKKRTSILILLFASFTLLAHNIIPHTHHDDHVHLLSPFGSHIPEPGNDDQQSDDPGHCPSSDLSDCNLEDLAVNSKSKRISDCHEVSRQDFSNLAALITETNGGHLIPIPGGLKSCYIPILPAILTGKSIPPRAPPVS